MKMNKKLQILALGAAMAIAPMVGATEASARDTQLGKQLANTHEHYAKLGKLNHTKEECVKDGLNYFDQSSKLGFPNFHSTIQRTEQRHSTEVLMNK